MTTSLGRMMAAVAAVATAAWCGSASAKVTIERRPPEIEHHSFDPKRPPASLGLKPGEAAVCIGNYGIAAQLVFSTVTSREGGLHSAVFQVVRVEATLTLKNDIWLPAGASPKLKSHEDGHRLIAEKIYAEVADRVIQEAAAAVDGQSFAGSGASADEARLGAQKKLDAAQKALIDAYRDGTSKAGEKIQEAYDAATVHGTKMSLSEADAIAQSWAAHPPPQWVAPSTQPSQRSRSPVPRVSPRGS